MEPVDDLTELTERIRRAANRASGLLTAPPGASPDVPGSPSPLSEVLPPFMVSAQTADLLDQARQILPRAHRKNEVAASVPKWLRPLYRNQGGFNALILEIMHRLITANRQLAEQKGQFRDWAEAVGQESAQNRARGAAMEARLEAFRDERLVEIEVRLRRLERQCGEPGARGEESSAGQDLADMLARIERLEKGSKPTV